MSMERMEHEAAGVVRMIYVKYPASTVRGLAERFQLDEKVVYRILADGVPGDYADLIQRRRDCAPGIERATGARVQVESHGMLAAGPPSEWQKREDRRKRVHAARKEQERLLRAQNKARALCGGSNRDRMLKYWNDRKAKEAKKETP